MILSILFKRNILMWLLVMWLPSIPLITATYQCDISVFHTKIKNLGFDSTDLSDYQSAIKQIKSCTSNENLTNHHELELLLNQLYYKMGVVYLSIGQEIKAIDSFESIVLNGKIKDSYTDLAEKRLDELYIEFGYWDKIKNDTDDIRTMFHGLNKTLYHKISKHPENIDVLQDELKPMLNISPYNYQTLIVQIEYLTKKLSIELDPSISNDLIRNYEIILEKFKTNLSLRQRLEIHYIISVLQMFILNTDPSNQLRKCLAIDMDYVPCKKLSLLNSKLNKINPHRAQILDSQIYAFPQDSDAKQVKNISWKHVLEFYLKKDQKPCVRNVFIEKDYRFVNNFKLVNDVIKTVLYSLFSDLFPFEGNRLLKVTQPDQYNTEFNKFLYSIVCEATIHSAKAVVKDLQAEGICKDFSNTVLDKDLKARINKAIKNSEPLEEGILEELWNSYPNMVIYIFDIVIHKDKSNKKPSKNNKQILEQMVQFYQKQKLSNSANPTIKRQIDYLNKFIEKRQRQRQNQQQQQFHFNFQQHHNGQQQNYQQQQRFNQQGPPPKADKDYYKILGISKSANSKDIRKAYLNLTKKYHPDKQGQLPEAEQVAIHEKMSEINEAYETLNDEEKRREYDAIRSGHGNGMRQPQFQRQQGGAGGFPFGNGPRNFMFKQGFPF